MALAIYFDQLLSEGVVTDQAELARLGHVSRARVTQIMNLLNLAPDIQEQLLDLQNVGSAKSALTERRLRSIMLRSCWVEQLRVWQSVLA
jgi:hypothetical protein